MLTPPWPTLLLCPLEVQGPRSQLLLGAYEGGVSSPALTPTGTAHLHQIAGSPLVCCSDEVHAHGEGQGHLSQVQDKLFSEGE